MTKPGNIIPATGIGFADSQVAGDGLVKEGGRVENAQARQAAARIRELARTVKLGQFDWQEWKSCRDHGRP